MLRTSCTILRSSLGSSTLNELKNSYYSIQYAYNLSSERTFFSFSASTSNNPTNQNNTYTKEAFRDTSLGCFGDMFSFSASGWLIPFHFGVQAVLKENGRLNDDSFLVGASGGAIAAATFVAGMHPEFTHQLVKQLAADIKPKGVWGKVKAPLEELLMEHLPSDAVERCNGRLALALTRVWPRPSVGYPEMLTEFSSKEDLVQAILASSYIPVYIDYPPVMKFRDGLYIDGGTGTVIPPLPGAINVCTFPKSIVSFGRCPDYHIGPDVQLGDMNVSAKDLNTWTLNPPDSDKLDYLFELGMTAGRIWLEETNSHSVSMARMNSQSTEMMFEQEA